MRTDSATILSTFLILVGLAIPAQANDALQPALTAIDNREFKRAIDTLSAIKPQDQMVQFHLGRAQFRAGELKAALKTVDSLVDTHPEYADAWYLKGLIHLSRLGQVSIFRMMGEAKGAQNSWKQAVEIEPDHIDALYGIFAYYANAPGIAGGDLDKAKELQVDLAAQSPAYGLLAEGLILTKEEQLAAAEIKMKEAAVLMDRAGPHFGLAQFYINQDRHEDALEQIAIFDEKEKRWWDPDITFSHTLKARAYAALGNKAEARRFIELALSLNPNDRVKELISEVEKDL